MSCLLADLLCQICDGTGTGQEVPSQAQQALPLSRTQSDRQNTTAQHMTVITDD